jgi:DNA-binding response OmpR family regulator
MERRTILLVDDEDLLRRLLARVLIEAGYNVIQAKNGAEGLAMSQTLDGSLGLLVTDIHMPTMGGIEFARHLRTIHSTVPILFITGRESDLPPDLNGTLLRKPFRAEAFLAAISTLL